VPVKLMFKAGYDAVVVYLPVAVSSEVVTVMGAPLETGILVVIGLVIVATY